MLLELTLSPLSDVNSVECFTVWLILSLFPFPFSLFPFPFLSGISIANSRGERFMASLNVLHLDGQR